MKHLGDITKINGAEVPLVDIVTGGSPCQDLSVAGKRAGLDGERSGLFMEQIRVIKEMRNESIRQLSMRGATDIRRCIQPRYMVWENVPGAFSSNKGEDFRCVLEETARVVDKDAVIPLPRGGKWTPSGCIMGRGWSIAWRVHDAQFWGVPQRRKRIALVADFAGESAPEILFERKGVSGDIEPGREKGQGITATSEGDSFETISFQERAGCDGGAKEYSYNITEQEHCQPSTTKVYCLQGNGIDRADTAGCNGKGWREDEAYTLNTIDRHAVCWNGSDTSPTLTANNAGGGQRMPDKDNFNAVITYGIDRASFNQGQNAQFGFSVDEELAQPGLAKGWGGGINPQIIDTLCARDFKGIGRHDQGKCIIQNIRRQR